MGQIHYLFPPESGNPDNQTALDLRHAHPKLPELHSYWQGKLRGRALPLRSELDVTEFAGWLGNLSLVEVVDGGRDFYYRVHGTNKVQYLGRDLTGRHVSDLDAVSADIVASEYKLVVATGKPQFVSRSHINIKKEQVRTDKLMLPLSVREPRESVDMILVGLYAWFGRAKGKSL